MDCSPPGSSVYGVSQVRILERVAIAFSRGSSWPRDWTHASYVSCIAGAPLVPPGKLTIVFINIYTILCLSIHGLIGHVHSLHMLSSANNTSLYTAEQLLDFKIRQKILSQDWVWVFWAWTILEQQKCNGNILLHGVRVRKLLDQGCQYGNKRREEVALFYYLLEEYWFFELAMEIIQHKLPSSLKVIPVQDLKCFV